MDARSASLLHVRIQGREFLWTPGEGLDSAVVATVDKWIHQKAWELLSTLGQVRGLELEDLEQAGRIGALEAARRFDPDRPNGYLAYAKHLIRRHQLEAIGRTDEVHQPSRTKRQALKAKTLPTVLRLEKHVGEDHTLGDLIPVIDPIQEQAEDTERVDLLRRALALLEPMERRVLTLRYGLAGDDPMRLEDVGQFLSPPVGRERVRQIQKRSESRLRGALRQLGMRETAPAPLPPEPPRSVQTQPAPAPNPGTRRAEREAQRARREAAKGTPLPLEITA